MGAKPDEKISIDGDEAALALTVAAARCIDAGLTDEQAGKGLLASLRSLRERLKRARAH